MPLDAVLGGQWGDEGKGKVSYLLSRGAAYCARFQGGSNAGHTTFLPDGSQAVLRMLPAGSLVSTATVLGNGMLLDLDILLREVDLLERVRPGFTDELTISDAAHIITVEHKSIDAGPLSKTIGTTGMGVGPAQASKVARRGIRVADVVARKGSRESLGVSAGTIEEFQDRLGNRCMDTAALMRDALAAGDRVVAEGGQGAALDIDHGDYPYVTSTGTTIGAVLTGLGVPPSYLRETLVVATAYTTKLGRGPFPSRLDRATEALLRERGDEWDESRSEYRACGWMDISQVRRSAAINGATGIVLTKADVLSGTERVGLWHSPDRIEFFPAWESGFQEEMLTGAMPAELDRFIGAIEHYSGVPVVGVSMGRGPAEFVWLSASADWSPIAFPPTV